MTQETLVQMLGIPPSEKIGALVGAIAAGDLGATLQAAADILDNGIAQDQLIEVLIERLRILLLIKACGPKSDLIELSDESKAACVAQAEPFDAAGLVHMIALCENVGRHAKNSSNPRALLDATLVRLALSEKMADVTGLLRASGGAGSIKKK